ncbi:hypothetical protein [Kitasatospora sp. NPDC087314]|uniref:hypothetical protein n=1 Tax=Kitasatospora sp. NPDC087314 TaxID=3364068 RepID=UPI0038248712
MIGKDPKLRISSLLGPSGPQRALIVANSVSRVGNGLFNTAAVLYFTLVVHLPAARVGIGLTIAGLVGLIRVPNYQPLPRPKDHHRWAVLSDRPFVSFVALYGAMGLQYETVSLLLPIWLSAHTGAPRWTVAAVYAVNSGVCVLFQSRIGSRVETPREGGRAFRLAGLLFLVSCPLMTLTADVPVWIAPGLAILAVCVHSLGEVWESSGGFALGFGLAPDHAQGQYQGLFGIGFDAGQALAPAVLTTAVLGLGHAGWLLLGAFFAALGAAGPPVAAWAERTRRSSHDTARAAHGQPDKAPLPDSA